MARMKATECSGTAAFLRTLSISAGVKGAILYHTLAECMLRFFIGRRLAFGRDLLFDEFCLKLSDSIASGPGGVCVPMGRRK
jgi:hypothetical protein